MNIQSISTSLPPQNRAVNNNIASLETKTVEVAPTQDTTQSVQPASHEQLKAAVQNVREYIEPINDALEFSLNDETGQVVVKIIDRDTKEVIRQMPSEEMIAIAKALDSLKGLLIKQKA